MLRKKGRYILALLIILFIWSYFHKKSEFKKLLTNNLNTLIDSIRVQDYFKISNQLDSNNSKIIPLDKIKEFSQNLQIDSGFKLKIDDYEDNKLIGKIKDNSKEHNFTILYKEENNTIKYSYIKIDNNELKAPILQFPIKE